MLEAGADRLQRDLEILEALRRLRREIAGLAGALAGRVVAELAGDIDGAARAGHLDHVGVAGGLRHALRIGELQVRRHVLRLRERHAARGRGHQAGAQSACGGGTTDWSSDDNDSDFGQFHDASPHCGAALWVARAASSLPARRGGRNKGVQVRRFCASCLRNLRSRLRYHSRLMACRRVLKPFRVQQHPGPAARGARALAGIVLQQPRSTSVVQPT